MDERREKKNPVLRVRVNNLTVIVTFSENENIGLKDRVRDILTEAYEERLQDNRLLGNYLL